MNSLARKTLGYVLSLAELFRATSVCSLLGFADNSCMALSCEVIVVEVLSGEVPVAQNAHKWLYGEMVRGVSFQIVAPIEYFVAAREGAAILLVVITLHDAKIISRRLEATKVLSFCVRFRMKKSC